MKGFSCYSLIAGSFLLAVPLSVSAASTTTTFNSTITINASCTVSASNVAFGSVSATATNVDSTGGLTVRCTSGTSYTVSLGQGSNFSTTRRMADGNSNFVAYELYRDSARTQTWGANSGVDTLASTGTGADQSITIYGRVPSANQAAGSYTDAVLVTVTW